MAETIRIEGLRPLVRTFRKLESDVGHQIRDELKAAAGIVADEARSIATREGLVESGQLVAKIAPGVRGSTAVVRDSATRKIGKGAPYPYPRLFEYVLDRPFLGPALDAKRDDVIDRIDAFLDRLGTEDGF